MSDTQLVGSKARKRRSIDRRLKEVGEALEVLVTVDLDWLWEMQRRREQLAAPDGLGSSGGDGSGSKSSDETSSTERTAIAALPGCRRPHFVKLEGIKQRFCTRCGKPAADHVADPIGDTIEELFDLLDRATQALRTLGRKDDIVLRAADGYRGRQPKIGQCLACGKDVSGEGEDRLKSGYGPCCYSAWKRWSKQRGTDGLDQSHVIFRWERRNELAEIKAAEEAKSA